MPTNHKQLALHRILLYLQSHPISIVEAIVQESGAEPLRVYPLLFELAQEKKIRIVDAYEKHLSLIRNSADYFVPL